MAGMLEPARGMQWISAQLRASAAFTAIVPAARIFEGVAPPGTLTPFCVITLQSPGADLMGINAARIWSEPLYQVGVWVQTGAGYAAAVTAADAADAALHRSRGAIGDGTIVVCYREQPMMRTAVEPDGTTWSVLGGFYRQQVRPTA